MRVIFELETQTKHAMFLIKILVGLLELLAKIQPIRFGLGKKLVKWLLKRDCIGLCYDICCLIPHHEVKECIDMIIKHELKSKTNPKAVGIKVSALPCNTERAFWWNQSYQKMVSYDRLRIS